MIAEDVLVYAARVDEPGGRVPGIALIFPSEAAAQRGFGAATQSVVEGRLPSSEVRFSSTPETAGFTFEFKAYGPGELLAIRAGGFPRRELDALLRLLKEVPYYFVVFGYQDAHGIDLLPPKESCLYKGSLVVDDQTHSGHADRSVSWNSLFDHDLGLGTFL